VVDFFAGSGSTTRVAIEEGRHSIASDSSPKPKKFLVQLRNMNVDGAELLGTSLQYKILESGMQHILDRVKSSLILTLTCDACFEVLAVWCYLSLHLPKF
jgi:hypothetical protein